MNLNYIYDSCKLMGEELNNRKQMFNFDIDNGGKFLSLQYGKPMNHDDNIFIANKIANEVVTETSFYKNKIHPIANSVLNFVKETINEHSIKPNRAAEYSISTVKPDEVIYELLKNKYFNFNYKNEINAVIQEGTDFKPIYKEDIELKDSGLNRAGKKLFHSGDFTNENIDKLFSIMNAPLDIDFRKVSELSTLAKAFLYSHMLSEEYPDFNKVAKKLAIRLMGTIEKYEDYLNLGVLILNFEITPTDKILYILEESLEKLPEPGELTEALFGLALHPDINTDFNLCLSSNLIANKEEYEKRWNLFISASQYEDPFVKQKNYRSIFELAFLKQIEEMSDEVLEYTQYDINGKEKLKIDIHNYLQNKTITEDIDSLVSLIYDILGEIIFTKTNYKLFVDECKEILNKNNKLQMDDVIILVNAKFIVKYLLGKTKVFEIK